jgi:hypothetical protein
LTSKNYRDELKSLLTKSFTPAGYRITKEVTLDLVAQSSKYNGLSFALDDRNIVYRQGKVTADRPGAFLAVWQRPPVGNINGNKPVPLSANALDYLFVQVQSHASHACVTDELAHSVKQGMFIFPVSLLLEKGIVASTKSKGKTGFRVFPPWSQDRGLMGTKVFSESGKKTQRWQLPYFLAINDGLIDCCELKKVLSHKVLSHKVLSHKDIELT